MFDFSTDSDNENKLALDARPSDKASIKESNLVRQSKASKYRGVYRCGKDKWKAQIQIAGTQHYLGVFETQEKAAREYNLFAIRNGRPDQVNSIESDSSSSSRQSTNECKEFINQTSLLFDDKSSGLQFVDLSERGRAMDDSTQLTDESNKKVDGVLTVSKDALRAFQLTFRLGTLIKRCLFIHKNHDYSQFLYTGSYRSITGRTCDIRRFLDHHTCAIETGNEIQEIVGELQRQPDVLILEVLNKTLRSN